jgi:hypothetical protein
VRRRAGAALALLAYLAATLGFALPHPVRKSGRPFPCQHHLCGCQTAEQCWRHCCCYSPEERRDWARKNNVPVPADAEQPATNQSWCSTRLRDRASGKSKTHACGSACCAGKKKRTCCSARAKADRAPAGHWTPTLATFHCQGLTTVWISGGAVLPAPPGPEWNPNLALVCQLSHSPCRAPRRPAQPLAPPPRFAIA